MTSKILRGRPTYPQRVAAVLCTALVFHLSAHAATQLVEWGYIYPGGPPSDATNLVAVAGGDNHRVALRADGRVIAWGQNNYGQTNVPVDVTNAVRIGAGSTHSLAVLDDGTLRFWGSIYTTGVTNPPPSAVANLVDIAPGGTAQHVLTIRSDGMPVEWGNSGYGLPSVPAKATNVIAAADASYHGLVLRADGTLATWGAYFPLGNPVTPPAATNVVAIASGFNFDLALRADGSLVSWGAGASQSALPAGVTNITAIACGGSQALALRADGALLSWNPGSGANPVPAGLSNIVAIAATTTGNLAIKASDGVPLFGRNLKYSSVAASTVRLRPTVLSTTAVSYQWMYYGTNLPGATNLTLILTNVQSTQAGDYVLVASNLFGVVTNSGLNLTVVPLAVQTAPQSQLVSGGSNVTFSVGVFGQSPFSYQWQWYGTNLAGATKSSLTLTNLQLSQAGPYSVVVTNQFGAVTSPSAALAIVPLFITTQPMSVATYVGGQPSFSVVASGKGPYGYQWQFFGTNLPGATTNPLVLSGAHLADAGPYSVAVSNAFGVVQSSNAWLTVVPILVSTEPQSQSAFLGQTISLSVMAQASGALGYQWQFNGADLPGATASTFTLTNCAYTQSGSYRAIIKDGSDVTNSTTVALDVAQVAAWGYQDQTTVPVGLSNVVALAGGFLHSLGLRTDGTVVLWGTLSSTLPVGLTNVAAIAAGGYFDLALLQDGTVVAGGSNGSGQSNVPSDVTNALAVAAGDSHSLALKADGTVRAWGNNGNNQTNVPPGLSNVVAIAAGYFHSLALRADGTVVAWGYNGDGETNVPAGLSNVVAIAGGDVHSLALKADGTVVVWGSTAYGVLNVPVGATNLVAIAGGYAHCLALRADGTVLAWGDGNNGDTTVPVDLRNVTDIGAGFCRSLALVSEGGLRSRVSLFQPSAGSGGFSVSLTTRSGSVYRLEYKNSLSDSTWTPLPLVAGTGRVVRLNDPATNAPQRFYRVRAW